MINTRAEVLISRMIDGEAGPAEWQEFSSLAAATPELWRELAESQRQQRLLCSAVADATNVAAAVDLPDIRDHELPVVSTSHALKYRISAWVGWGAAAALAIALWTGVQPTSNTGSSSSGQNVATSNRTGLDSFAPDQLLKAYLERGKDEGVVLGELPDKVLLETRPDPSGKGYEVLFIRTILERTSVPNLYQLGPQDEAGRPVLAKFQDRTPKPL